MSYHYYGGTRETSIERDMADVRWVEKHSGAKGLAKLAKQDRIITISSIILSAFALFAVGALVVWGLKNIFESGFSWEILLFNPLTIVVLMVGVGISAINRA